MSSRLIRHEIYGKLRSEILEAGVMRLAIGRASKAELNALSKFRFVSTDDVDAFAEYNRLFHVALCEVSQSKRIAKIMRGLENRPVVA